MTPPSAARFWPPWSTRDGPISSPPGRLGATEIALPKFAFITKVKPDGTLKHRLIWDLLRSGVNSTVRQGERIILPRLPDLVQDALQLRLASPDATPLIFGTDVSDAFHNIPIRPDEWRFVCASVLDHFYVFTVVISGAASAPHHLGGVLEPS